MKLAKALLVLACASLLSAGPVRHAYAQDGDKSDLSAGAWGAPDASVASPDAKTKVRPLGIKGCWSGEVVDTGDGAGTASFQFDQNSNRKKVTTGSTFDFQWTDSAFARGPIKGTVSATGFKLKGKAGAGCTISGSGTGDATSLTGTFEFVGGCATIFEDVTFSITPGCP
jgi:hypothetical protein